MDEPASGVQPQTMRMRIEALETNTVKLSL